jgi:pimeloyl-ACP methyl ester carboxylesterase
MLDYYRALPIALREVRRAARVPVVCPTLVLWGERDRYLSVRLLDGLERWVPRLAVHRYPDATHWVVAEEPDDVSDRVARFARGR